MKESYSTGQPSLKLPPTKVPRVTAELLRGGKKKKTPNFLGVFHFSNKEEGV